MDEEGFRIVSGKTENHMFLADVRSIDEDLTGKEASQLLDRVGITLNRNSIPFDPRSPFITSGLRLGTPAVTTAGMRQEQMITLGRLIVEVLRNRESPAMLAELEGQITELSAAFPGYPEAFPGHV